MSAMSHAEVDAERRPFMTGLSRGLKHQCPNCGEGKLYRGYLKVQPTCAVCAHDLSAYRADDGPAYFTILLIGHLLIAPLLLFPVVWEASPWIVVPASLTMLTTVVLTTLPRIKGAFIGGLWSIRPAPAHG
jgi:uncharacterized protein (DUF983 family)